MNIVKPARQAYMKWTEVWKPLPEAQPRKVLMDGFVCPSGQHMYAGADDRSWQLAQYCCGPWVCQQCDRPMLDRGYIWCESCRQTKEAKRWDEAPRAAAEGAMIYAGTNGQWFDDIDALQEYLEFGMPDGPMTPASLEPWIGEFQEALPPNLAESISGDMPDEWETPDWLEDLQAQVNAAFAEHKPGAWFPGNTVPILPEAPNV